MGLSSVATALNTNIPTGLLIGYLNRNGTKKSIGVASQYAADGRDSSRNVRYQRRSTEAKCSCCSFAVTLSSRFHLFRATGS